MNKVKAILLLKLSIVISMLYFLSSCSKGEEPTPMASSNSFSESNTSFSEKSKSSSVGVVGGDDKEDDDDNRGVPRKR